MKRLRIGKEVRTEAKSRNAIRGDTANRHITEKASKIIRFPILNSSYHPASFPNTVDLNKLKAYLYEVERRRSAVLLYSLKKSIR